jgi:hypothetical protein
MSFTGTLYRGHDLLTVMPNGREDRDQDAVTSVDTLDSLTGRRFGDDQWLSPVLDWPFLWFLPDRATINDFLWWVALRRGRFSPCWVPTWRRELTLRTATLTTDTALVIEDVDYTSKLFPLESRRHIAAVVPGAGVFTIIPRRVTAAVDNGDGTETLTIESAFGVALDSKSVISFLTLCRLDEDSVVLHWFHPNAAEARTRFVELPRQVEATA